MTTKNGGVRGRAEPIQFLRNQLPGAGGGDRKITIVTLLWRNQTYAHGFVDSLEAAACRAGVSVELIAVENGPDGQPATAFLEERLRELSCLEFHVVRTPVNRGFAGGVNLGCQRASGDVFVVANLDLVFSERFLIELRRAAEVLDQPSFLAPSVVTPRAGAGRGRGPSHEERCEEDGALRRGRLHRLRGLSRPPKGAQRVPAGNGSCLVFGRSLYDLRVDAIGGLFDYEYHSYYEDVDLFWWADNRGVPVWFDPHLRVIHYQGGSFGGKYRFRDRTSDVQTSIMANYRITVWKHASAASDVFFWLVGECGYLLWSLLYCRWEGARNYVASWVLASRRARAIRARRGRLRDVVSEQSGLTQLLQ
jgi:GT2 family glycosyltransferase